ncbi:MAG TPA: DEAD/DEAH box helicase [Kofleriaceae bacterium]|nr:DEAD/DEAH box helicase [Kofleriaceae bacterium]
MSEDPLAPFGEPARAWFRGAFASATPVQARGWAAIARGRHTLMLAPTGSGKTLAAFLWALDRLATPGAPGTRVVYISPLKALAYDVERNLRAPLAGMGLPIAIDVRTGDTPAKERERQRKQPGEILVTTPESLYLVLAGRSRERLRAVETVIVDEIHALAPTKRGMHLALTLERLAHLTGRDPQRIGLSATQRPLTEVARYLGGDREVEIVDASAPPALDLEIVVPAAEMDHPGTAAKDAEVFRGGDGLWPLLYPRLLDDILAHRSTIVFVNSRRLAERVAQQLSELAVARGMTEDFVRAHHGSVARPQRLAIEEALKAGRLRAIVATSSLELGIDMGAVDLVLQIESPGAVSRGLQRIGRAGHQVGGTSRGRLYPKFRGDLLETAVVARRMAAGDVEPIRVPEGALDVLAQQLVAMVGVEPWRVGELEGVVRRAASYRELPRAAFTGVLDMLAGRYPSDEFADLRPRLTWDRQADVVTARRGAALLAVTSGGTIPDRGLYSVNLGEGGPKVGELDEEMVAESRKGETFLLGASTWRIEDITRDRVIVSPAPGEPGKMPFWRAEGPGRPVELGRALGAFTRELDARIAGGDAPEWLARDYKLDVFAAQNLIAYVAEQRARGGLPTDRAIAIERFRDELGDERACILTPLGSRVHAPWALVLAHRLEQRLGYPVHPLWTDDGIALRFADADVVPGDDELVPDPDSIERELVDELARGSLFASHFRHNAARALLLPRRRPGQRTPLWAQRLRAQQLMGVALRFPDFPITLETYRELLRDVFDLPALLDLLAAIRRGEVAIEATRTDTASPFARSLVFDYVAAYLYQGDAPVAERKAQALTLDRELLRELVGTGELRELLDLDVIAEVEAELQATAEDRRARDADELHDLLRRLGDLSDLEIAARSRVAADALVAAGRARRLTLGGESRVIAADDEPRYRAPDPHDLVPRYARTHGPFTAAAVVARWGVPIASVETALALLASRGQLVRGELRPGATGIDWCDPEVLRQIRRRTLAKLRAQVAPVADATFAAFLPRWHGLDRPRRGIGALRDAIARLEGLPLPFAELEARVLPGRVVDYHPRMLDELGAAGELAWIGAGKLARDGRVILVRRARARALAPDPVPPEPASPLHAAILEHLARAGASFFVAIEDAARRPRAPRVLDQAAGDASSRADVVAALWDLVWAGLVTNDTFAPLRSLSAPSTRRMNPSASFGGRWSLVTALGPDPTDTARAHAQATALLDRSGIARATGRTADVLRAMEDAGTVRRGHFVAGLEGLQFAWPAAVDLLRAPRRGQAPRVDLLSVLDPACAWGNALPWPALRDPSARPMQRAGACIVQVDGALALWIEPSAKHVATAALADDVIALALVVGLPQLALRRRRRELLVATIDGEPAAHSRWRDAIPGARADYRGLVIPCADRAGQTAADSR